MGLAVGDGWWGASVACLAQVCRVYVVCMACFLSAPPRRLKSRSRCQGGYTQLEVGKPGTSLTSIGLAKGAKRRGGPTTMPGFDDSPRLRRAGSGMLMLIYGGRKQQHPRAATTTTRRGQKREEKSSK